MISINYFGSLGKLY